MPIERIDTMEKLLKKLQSKLWEVNEYSGPVKKAMTPETDQKKRVSDFLMFAQYMERKAFEMRLCINEYVEVMNAEAEKFNHVNVAYRKFRENFDNTGEENK